MHRLILAAGIGISIGMEKYCWKRDLQYAAVGIVSAALVELFARSAVNGARPRPFFGRLLLAGGVAAAYAHLVPSPQWGIRSGAAFAQLPVVVSVHSSLGGAAPLRLGLWGAVTGFALHYLQPPRF